jgi:hypothetical protein
MNAVRAHRASPDASATERARSQKGNALVEFAFVLPLFLFLVFGMITFSLALYDKTILTMATRDGARAGAVFVGTNTAKEQKAQNTADAYIDNLITFGTPPGSSPFVPKITGGIITVTATYVYTGLPSPYDGYILPATITLTAETNMIVE